MTPFPYSIASDASVPVAVEMMKTHGINHLPVMRGTELIGLLWNRDVGVAQRLSATGQARDDAERELQQVETELAETHQRLDALQAERRQLNDETTQLRQHRDRLESERDDQYAALSQQLSALYRLGPTPQLKLLLNQGDPAELDRMQAYLNRLTDARNRRLSDIARLDSALADTQRELAERQARLDDLAEELEEQSALLAERTTERRGVVSNLDDRYGSEEERLADLNQSREEAELSLIHI